LAEVTYIRALGIKPDLKDALHDLAIVYLAQGKVEEARKLLPRLTALNRGWGEKLRLLIARMK
jgi:Flp pilus assembly protein TadD